MTSREIVRKLEEAGFALLKRGSRHDLYVKGAVVAVVARCESGNPRAASSLRALIRRAERNQAPPVGRYI